jgi:hypothetical protein
VSTCSVPCSPATRPAPWPWTSTRVGPAAWRRRSRDAGQAAALGYGQPSCEPGTANAAPSLPVRPDAGRRPRRPRTTGARRPAAPDWGRPATPSHSRVQRGADTPGVAPRTPEACPSGHLDAPDTGRVDAGRPLDRLDGRPHDGTGDADRATTGLAGVRTSSRPATTRWAAQASPGSRRLGALGHPGRLRGDGTYAAALTAAATGQLPSTARHEAAARRTAVVCWSWMLRGEGNGTTER